MDKKDLIRWIDDRFLHWGGSVETINSLSSKILCELDNAIGEENATVESIKKKMMDTELYFSCIFLPNISLTLTILLIVFGL